MEIVVYIVLIVIYLAIASYMFKENIALNYYGRIISDKKSEEEEIQEEINKGNSREEAAILVKFKNIKRDTTHMNPITPAISVFFSYLSYAILFFFTIYGFYVINWYLSLIITFIVFYLSGYLSKLYPKPESKFWFKKLYKGLTNRRTIYLRNNDMERLNEVEYFIAKMEDIENL